MRIIAYRLKGVIKYIPHAVIAHPEGKGLGIPEPCRIQPQGVKGAYLLHRICHSHLPFARKALMPGILPKIPGKGGGGYRQTPPAHKAVRFFLQKAAETGVKLLARAGYAYNRGHTHLLAGLKIKIRLRNSRRNACAFFRNMNFIAPSARPAYGKKLLYRAVTQDKHREHPLAGAAGVRTHAYAVPCVKLPVYREKRCPVRAVPVYAFILQMRIGQQYVKRAHKRYLPAVFTAVVFNKGKVQFTRVYTG